jgi:RNA polymerase sigma-70 factor (ECF subfamily)
VIGESFASDLAAAQRGDRDAIETIYRDVSPLVIGYLRANRCDDADDVAADVLVAVISGLGTFAGTERQFRSWLLTIAHRRMIDQHRRRTRRPEVVLADPESASGRAPTTDGENEAMGRLRARGVLDAIDDLTPDQRAVVMLRALADLPVSDIARVMNKPETAVKALLRRGLASLRRSLEREQEVP